MEKYSHTLNLPKTAFPMRANLPKNEPEMQKWWDQMDIYRRVQEKTKGRPKFILHDGPPYANGDIHIGHALNKVIKDIIIRFKSMSGYDAPYVPGWDTHGLPIEQAVFQHENINRKEIAIQEFREACRQYALKYVNHQKKQFQRLSIRGDWQNPYITLQPDYEAAQIRLFGEMMSKGYIYKGLKTVYWSTSSETALAEAEIEYKEKHSTAIYVKFPLVKGTDEVSEGNCSLLIWTTTPWTIPANLGIAIHPDLDYVAVEVNGEKYILAAGLLEKVAKILGWQEPKILEQWKGMQLNGIVCRHPFYQRYSPVIMGEHVTLDSGTGCVHTAPGHGEEDFLLGQKYGLDVLCIVDEKGHITRDAPGLEGLHYEEANQAVIHLLDNLGALLHKENVIHSYPHDWRSKKPIVFRATEQWFASIDGFRETLMKAISKVKWHPSWGENRLHHMIAERNDWCISRQWTWGVPIPIFYCQQCDQVMAETMIIEQVANMVREEGSSTWYVRDVKDMMPHGVTCRACGGNDFYKETDTMDVWFDSGSSHEAVLRQREGLSWPADLYVEGSDQYRGWFNSSLTTSVAITGHAPYKSVLSHGFVLDGEGRKMSKSLGNVISPEEVTKKWGTDILRLWVASVDYQADVRISPGILEQTADGYRKIRNTFRFLLGNLYDFHPAKDQVDYDWLTELDKYMLIKLQRFIHTITKAYDEYRFHEVHQTFLQFCNHDLSAFYLEIIKRRLYLGMENSLERQVAQTVIYELLLTLNKLIAPIMPYTAEEVWRYVPGLPLWSVQLTDMPQMDPTIIDVELEMDFNRFMNLRDHILKAMELARSQGIIGNSLEATIDIYASAEHENLLRNLGGLEELLIVSKVRLYPDSINIPNDAMRFDGIAVRVTASVGEKCERCWEITPLVGQNEKYPSLCPRCITVISVQK